MDSPTNKEAIQQAAKRAGQSLTEYVVEACRRRMEQDEPGGVVKNPEPDTDTVE